MNYKQILLFPGYVMAYREERPDDRLLGSAASIKAWQDSGVRVEIWPIEENKILLHIFDPIPLEPLFDLADLEKVEKGIDVTGFVELKEMGVLMSKDVKSIFAFYKPPVEEEYRENQTRLFAEVMTIISSHKGSGTPILALLTKFKITRL